MNARKLISFDWALKRLLRSKANYEVLEGFLSELLKDDIEILEILESESNRDQAWDKANRVDMKVRNRNQEIILIEVQYEREFDFLQRILFATAKAITEHQTMGEAYDQVIKVISINILYFDLGYGADYIYHGRTHFVGLHHQDELRLNDKQRQLFGKRYPHELYPEYYLLKVKQFDNVARDSLDEWIYFLKNQEIKGEFQAKGLQKAKEVLDIMKLGDKERRAYERHMEELSYQASMYYSSFMDGHMEGEKKGLEKGIEKGKEEGREEGLKEGSKAKAVAMAKALKQEGVSLTVIAKTSGLPPEEVAGL